MTSDEIKTIAVIGSGLMGHGIAMEFALAGLSVRIHDVSKEKLDAARSSIDRDLSTLTAAKLISAEQSEKALQNIHPILTLEEVGDADFVVEAVFENLQLKQSIFSKLDDICPPRTILASNTSTLLPSALASATKRPEKVLVTHYFNPPYLLPLVEVVRGKKTSDETITTIVEFLRRIGKAPALVQKEVPGFIGNRLQIALLREALYLVEQGVASPQDVDGVIKNSFGRRLSTAGVFEVFELAGWDLLQEISRNLLPEISSSTEVSTLLQEKVKKGELGTKSGKGFYEWTPGSAESLRLRIADALICVKQFSQQQ